MVKMMIMKVMVLAMVLMNDDADGDDDDSDDDVDGDDDGNDDNDDDGDDHDAVLVFQKTPQIWFFDCINGKTCLIVCNTKTLAICVQVFSVVE